MTDTSTQKQDGGLAKAGFSGIYLMICQNITPVIVSFACKDFPLLNEASWFEIVVFSLGAIGSFIVWLTPQHFVDGVTNAIVFCREAWKKWRAAANQE